MIGENALVVGAMLRPLFSKNSSKSMAKIGRKFINTSKAGHSARLGHMLRSILTKLELPRSQNSREELNSLKHSKLSKNKNAWQLIRESLAEASLQSKVIKLKRRTPCWNSLELLSSQKGKLLKMPRCHKK